jgi:prepilin-type N-terminal cleavage/methylation domain-containing protein
MAMRRLPSEESGFSLLELLVVMLILGALAAIAVAVFASQTGKARDVDAKEVAQTALVAMQSCAAEGSDGYESCDAAALRALEPSLPPGPTLTVNGQTEKEFTIVVRSQPSSQRFKIERAAGGKTTFSCEEPGVGGCPGTGDWN